MPVFELPPARIQEWIGAIKLMYILFPTAQIISLVSVWDASMRNLCNETKNEPKTQLLYATNIWIFYL